MSVARALPDLTRTEDFLAWVWGQDYKFEMIEGRLVMMAGGSRNHSTIAVNAAIALGNRLAGGPCRPYNSDFLVEASDRNRYYPDVSVACGETRDFTDRPVLVVEVLSPGTQREDLGPKLQNYPPLSTSWPTHLKKVETRWGTTDGGRPAWRAG
jgi:Uma2 family endonuclease